MVSADLESRMYGGGLGAELASPVWDGWRFFVKPGINVSLAATRMRAIMDRNKYIFAWTDELTVSDARHHVVAETKLMLGAEYVNQAFSFRAEVKGMHSYGRGQIDMPDRIGYPANIETAVSHWAIGANLKLSVEF